MSFESKKEREKEKEREREREREKNSQRLNYKNEKIAKSIARVNTKQMN